MSRPPSAADALASTPLPSFNVRDGITVWTADDLDQLRNRGAASNANNEKEFYQFLTQTINLLGARSRRAQKINDVLTSVAKLHETYPNSQHAVQKLYIVMHDHRGAGILKTGVKKLFLTHPRTNQLVETEPLSVLDFYVDETIQRKGFGKQLFVRMLQEERLEAHPERIAIDRPSDKFLQFLKKNYHLAQYTPQVNKFVVFHSFFEGTTVSERGILKRLPDTHAAANNNNNNNNDSNNNNNNNNNQNGRDYLKGDPGVTPLARDHFSKNNNSNNDNNSKNEELVPSSGWLTPGKSNNNNNNNNYHYLYNNFKNDNYSYVSGSNDALYHPTAVPRRRGHLPPIAPPATTPMLTPYSVAKQNNNSNNNNRNIPAGYEVKPLYGNNGNNDDGYDAGALPSPSKNMNHYNVYAAAPYKPLPPPQQQQPTPIKNNNINNHNNAVGNGWHRVGSTDDIPPSQQNYNINNNDNVAYVRRETNENPFSWAGNDRSPRKNNNKNQNNRDNAQVAYTPAPPPPRTPQQQQPAQPPYQRPAANVYNNGGGNVNDTPAAGRALDAFDGNGARRVRSIFSSGAAYNILTGA